MRATPRRGRRRWILRGYNDWYEVQIGEAAIEAMPGPDLVERLQTLGFWNTVDFLECESQASRLVHENDPDSWVAYPSGLITSRP